MKVYISRRQYELLSILEREKEWKNSDELGKLLNVSNKTIQKEIHIINQILPDGWTINITNGLGYNLEQPISEGVKLKFIVEDELLMHDVLNSIINKDVTNLTELADKFYISVSAAHKLIQKINKRINTFYHVTIVDRPLRLVGDENPIRRIMYDLNYFNNSKFHNNELYIIEKNDFDLFLINNLRITMSRYNKNTFYTFLDVAIKRIREGFEAEGLPEELMEPSLRSDLYFKIEPLFTYIEKTYQIQLSRNERSIIYFGLMRTDFHLVESYAPDFFKNNNNLNRYFLAFIDYLSDLFNLDLRSSTDFLIKSFNIYYLNYYLVDILNILYSNDLDSREGRDHFDETINKHHLPLEEFTTACEYWGENNNVKFSKHIIVSFLILIQEFNLTHTKINIFVVKSHSFILNDLLITELKRDLGYKVNFLEYEPSVNRNFTTIKKNIDFIMSDIILPRKLSSIPLIYVSEYITDKKLIKIRKLINDAIKDKEKLKLNIPVGTKK